ncbi:unnamed protein product [Urochloa decumbens]|uniref:Sof1-like protein domain-containing protein n=1 Tax=Urochloa decumbens TaxID=240449 RepID=A0ABC8Z0D7_9POAL
MRVKVISRSTDEFTRERSQDLQKVFRNYDPGLRSQEKAVEYTRALNAAKLEKIFAKPFIGAMDGHIDAVSCMAKNPNHLKAIFSGSMDGAISSLYLEACILVRVSFFSHLTFLSFLSAKAVMIIFVLITFRGADHQWDGNLFATVGAQVDIWDPNRSEPVNSFEWGKDTVLSVRFDPGDCNILITSASDRSLTLYDLRMSSPATKLIMKTRCNSVCWNPREPMNFTAANEDTNCYSFDARKLNEAKIVHKGHVSAVVFCVKYTYDGTYLVSGSDDTNLRLWKSKASEQLGVLLPRERKKQEYLDAVKERYKHLPEVKRIVRHRHLPKPIYKAANLRRTMIEAENRKEERRRKHSAPGSMPVQPFRKRRIIKEVE